MSNLRAVLDFDTRISHMAYAVVHGAPGLKLGDHWSQGGRISIVGYGPSLAETWESIPSPIMATSGAMAYLKAKGRQVDSYVALDPRPHKMYWIRDPDPQVTYFMASVVCPWSWGLLAGCRTWRWHSLGVGGVGDWAVQNDPDTLRVKSGSEVGLGALRLAWMLGFREFDLYGMDHTVGYAGYCPNPSQEEVDYLGYRTTPQLLVGAAQMRRSLKNCNARIHGDSLVNHIVDDPGPTSYVIGTPVREFSIVTPRVL